MKFYKDYDFLEICLVLFKQCSLHCPFCFQHHIKDISLDSVKKLSVEVPNNIKDDLERLVKSRKIKKIIFRIWGGEVFQDFMITPEWIDIFNYYKDLTANLTKVCNELGISEIVFCWSSNLAFNEDCYGVVKKFIDEQNNSGYNTIVATSYDPIYRFHNEEVLNNWLRNVKNIKVDCVSITLTKQNINEFLKVPIHFDRLKDLQVYNEYYIYSDNYEFFRPSENDLFNFYKYCFDNNLWNNIEASKIVESLVNKNIDRYCNCNSSCLSYFNGKNLSFNCLKRSSSLKMNEFFDNQDIDDERYSEMQCKEALFRKGCMLCERFDYCRNFCMASVLHKSYDYNQVCLFKQLYKYLEDNENIINNWKEYVGK